jgi:hypothetical protein
MDETGKTPAVSTGGALRRADWAGIPVLVDHHRRMFAEIRTLSGETPEPASMKEMDAS